MLSNFQMNCRSLLQSFLLGQREFRATMRSEGFEQLRQRVIAAYHLKPLDLEETRGYIEHRLRRAGWKNDPAISPDIYPGIYQFTGGVPRRVNTLCDRLLLFGYLEDKHTLDLNALRTVASDILEEHGDPGLEHASGFEATPETGGDDWYEQDVVAPEPAQTEPAASPAAFSGNESAPKRMDDGAERFAAMEHSMLSLTEAVRSELSAIKEALKLAQAGGGVAPADPHTASTGPESQTREPAAGGDTLVTPAEPANEDVAAVSDSSGAGPGGTQPGEQTRGDGAEEGDDTDSGTKTEPDPPMFLASRRP
ncbi:MAG: hypothetical protein ACR2RL_15105 [Gammaproteobacteria bacterium]